MSEKLYDLTFDPENYTVKTVETTKGTVTYRAYENIIYVSKPVDLKFHSMNIYVPESAVDRKDVPIFFRNYVGGYMSTPPITPDVGQRPEFLGVGLREALARGYVAVSPGARGREDKVGDIYTGKAPADIVDLKAAIRYLRHNVDTIPGDTSKIISDGSSAGGAMSSLLGTTGNDIDYEPYLEEIGAARERDDIYGAICFCPIIDLEHANGAYEWSFGSVKEFDMMKPRPVNNELVFDKLHIKVDEEGHELAKKFTALFAEYQMRLGLKDPATGETLTLEPDGRHGSYFDYLLKKLSESATEYLTKADKDARTKHLADRPWLKYDEATGKASITADTFEDFIAYVGRGKQCPTFDGFDCDITENSLFGTETVPGNHFDVSLEHVTGDTGKYAVPESIKDKIALMNPMVHVNEEKSTVAPYFYIRWGSIDSNHSYSAPMNLALALENSGRCKDVDFKFAWDYDHDGDYELDEMFGWVEKICR